MSHFLRFSISKILCWTFLYICNKSTVHVRQTGRNYWSCGVDGCLVRLSWNESVALCWLIDSGSEIDECNSDSHFTTVLMIQLLTCCSLWKVTRLCTVLHNSVKLLPCVCYSR